MYRQNSNAPAQAVAAAPQPPTGVVHECKPTLDSIGNLLEPVRSFAKGNIKIAHISTGEPAASPEHLLVFVDTGHEGMSDCFAVSAAKYPDSPDVYQGYYALEFDKLHASYDENKGLLLQIPSSVNDGGTQKPAADLKVRINRANAENPAVTTER
jgi:hypothetical protein